jgi:8-oxo-dGTP pyrophosphatase MutT (NUDIX family)
MKKESADLVMEPGFVKTPEDEKKWARAKAAARKQNPDDFYALANHIFHKMKGEATVDHISTGNPDNPKESGGSVVPDNELQRTNSHGVAVSEFASAGQIDPDKAKDAVERKKEALGDLGGKTGMTQFDEQGIQVEDASDRAFDRGRQDGETGGVRQIPDEWQAYAMGYAAGEKRRMGEAELGLQGEPEREASERGTKTYTTAVAVIVKNYRYVLLGKAKDSGDDREGMWVFPGGGIDPEDGDDPSKAAQREAFEEMGILVTPMTEILTHPEKPGIAFVVCVYSDDQDPQPNKEFSQWMWLDHDMRHEQEGIYPQNRSILDRIPERYLKRVAEYSGEVQERFDAALDMAEEVLGETAALKRQKDNKRAFAVSSKKAGVAKGKSAEPDRRSKAGSSDKTKDSPTDQAVAATQNIKAKKTLSTPGAPQDSAEKLHFTGGANPRKAAGDAMTDLERQKQGRDPAALKPGDAGKEGAADAQKKAKEAGAPAPAKGAAPAPAAGGVPSDALIKAAQAVLAAAGKAPAGSAPATAPAAKKPAGNGEAKKGSAEKPKSSAEAPKSNAQSAQAAQGAPAPAGAPAATAPQPGAQPAQPAAPQGGQPAPGAQGAGQPGAEASPAAPAKKDAQTQAASPGATPPAAGQPPAQTAAQTAAPPGQIPQQPQAQGAQFGPPQQPQPGQPMDPNQPQAMPQGQPGVADPNTPPGMQPPAQGMPTFQPRTVDLVLKDRKNAEKMFRWLQTMGFQQVSTPDGTTVQAVINSHEDMNIINRTAKAFGLELSGITP